MKIKFLGTAAYEAFPAIGCSCDTCKRAWQSGGRNLRSRTQALVNDDLLIDFPEDSVWHFMANKIDYDKIKTCLITHSHSDHLSEYTLEALGPSYTKSDRTDKIAFYAARSGYDKIESVVEGTRLKERATADLVTPYVPFSVNGYDVLPIAANHDPRSTPINYRIERDGKSIFYGHDTGYPFDRTFDALASLGRLDLISLDCTGSFLKGWRDHHLSIDVATEVFDKLKSLGVIDDKTVKVLNHFSHNGLATYDDMLEEVKGTDVVISYDGMEIEF
ncbi:MAG: MBL fold metallo-hydrolase [Clostridia bacterium]|nr:MBL fold metallo-hydrolase [Clostridia bacterium]